MRSPFTQDFGYYLTNFAYYAKKKKYPARLTKTEIEEAVVWISEQLHYENLSAVRSWCKGEQNSKLPLSKDNFWRLMGLWAGETPGLSTLEDLLYFAKMGKAAYADHYYEEKTHSILVTRGERTEKLDEILSRLKDSPLSPFWESGLPKDLQPLEPISRLPALPRPYLERPEMQEKLLKMMEDCSAEEQRVLVLSGKAGAGKATLMAWLARHARYRRQYLERRIWLRGQAGMSSSEWLGLLQRYLSPATEAKPNEPAALAYLVSQTREEPWLFLLENCDSGEFLEVLPQLLNESSRAVVTSPEGSIVGACSVLVPGLERLEILNLYQEVFRAQPSAEALETLTLLGQAVEGNLFALRVLLALWQETQTPERLLAAMSPKGGEAGNPAERAMGVWLVLPPNGRCLGHYRTQPV